MGRTAGRRAGLAARVFDWADAGPVEDDVPLRRPCTASTGWSRTSRRGSRWWSRWTTRTGPTRRRCAGSPTWPPASRPAGRAAARRAHGPDEPGMLDELRAARDPAAALRPLGRDATAALVRERLGGSARRRGAVPGLPRPAPAGTRSCSRRWPPRCATGRRPADAGGNLAPEPVARAVLRRVGQVGGGAGRLTRALAVLGGPAPLRHAAALAGLDLPGAARLADGCARPTCWRPARCSSSPTRSCGPPSTSRSRRASGPWPTPQAARLLERDGADAERLALHLLRSEPGGDPRVVALLRAAAAAASGRGDPGAAAAYLRRALDEPPDPPRTGPPCCSSWGSRWPASAAPPPCRPCAEAVELATARPRDAALLSARVLGIWAYHAEAAAICRDALAGAVPAGAPTASRPSSSRTP